MFQKYKKYIYLMGFQVIKFSAMLLRLQPCVQLSQVSKYVMHINIV